MKEELIPAPLNQKDIMEDALFDELFDNSDYVECDHCALGFIGKQPVSVQWSFNHNSIRIWPQRSICDHDKAKRAIIRKLTEMNNEPDAQTFCTITDLLFSIVAKFYYKPEN